MCCSSQLFVHQKLLSKFKSSVKSKETDVANVKSSTFEIRERRPAQARLARRSQPWLLLLHFPTGKTGATTAASTLYRSSKLRLAAFMTEGGLAAVVAAAAKTRGIGCKGDLVRVFSVSVSCCHSTKILPSHAQPLVVKWR